MSRPVPGLLPFLQKTELISAIFGFGFGLFVQLTFEVSLNAAKDDVPQLDPTHLEVRFDFFVNQPTSRPMHGIQPIIND